MRVLVLVGTLLPVLGVGVTCVGALVARGTARLAVLAVVPAVTAVACWYLVEPVWRDGNLLAAALYLAYWSALVFYYPALVLIVVIRQRRARRAVPVEGMRRDVVPRPGG